MEPGQSLEALTARVVTGMGEVIHREEPDVVVVQGDTTTTFAAALAAFYQGVEVAHVEAGLRTGRKDAPFPEEINRQLTTRLTDYHFPPTERAAAALRAEGVSGERIWTVGNTVIDALLSVLDRAREQAPALARELPGLRQERPLVLITGHRRENFGEGFQTICEAIRDLARANEGTEFVYPVHLNPNVQGPVHRMLGELENVHLIAPQPYLPFVWLMSRSRLILTDSGGVQEEAPSLGVPILVMRETTERPEAVDAGVAKLVGASREAIVAEAQNLLDDPDAREAMSRISNPYGDGTAARAIAEVLAGER
jgi:UDP-N-acetylglucosamine 2-epimerase (non-hydrolysing)